MDGTERAARYGIDQDNERGIRAVLGCRESEQDEQKRSLANVHPLVH
jgi:hypothetical protein